MKSNTFINSVDRWLQSVIHSALPRIACHEVQYIRQLCEGAVQKRHTLRNPRNCRPWVPYIHQFSRSRATKYHTLSNPRSCRPPNRIHSSILQIWATKCHTFSNPRSCTPPNPYIHGFCRSGAIKCHPFSSCAQGYPVRQLQSPSVIAPCGLPIVRILTFKPL